MTLPRSRLQEAIDIIGDADASGVARSRVLWIKEGATPKFVRRCHFPSRIRRRMPPPSVGWLIAFHDPDEDDPRLVLAMEVPAWLARLN